MRVFWRAGLAVMCSLACVGQLVTAAPARAAQGIPFTFHSISYPPTTGSTAVDAYRLAAPIPLVDSGLHDSSGVRMTSVNGTLYNHPVLQAQYGLANLESYGLTKDQRFLQRALAQAQRLVDTRVQAQGAWFFPYEFDFALHGIPTETMKAPWYSAMAQGQALSLFSRLFTVTGDPAWKTAADATFQSFFATPSASGPWVTHTDSAGYLWLEEYPRYPDRQSDFTLNGLLFAAFGLYDYYQVSLDANAAALFDGAVTTARQYSQTSLRVPGFLSRYCVSHGVQSPVYHLIHIRELLTTATMTGDTYFARIADLLLSDFPPYLVTSSMIVGAGRRTFYRYDSAGHVVASRTVQFSRASSAPIDRRERIKGHGVNYRVSAGFLAGWWIPELYPAVRMTGRYADYSYAPQRSATFAPGTYSAYRFDASGRRLGYRTATFAAATTESFDATSFIGGRSYVRITSGGFAGLWVPDVAIRRS